MNMLHNSNCNCMCFRVFFSRNRI